MEYVTTTSLESPIPDDYRNHLPQPHPTAITPAPAPPLANRKRYAGFGCFNPRTKVSTFSLDISQGFNLASPELR